MANVSEPHRGFSRNTVRMIQAELKRLRKEHCAITRRVVLDAARPPDSLLHRFFDWDDTSAAEKYRIEQAGNLLRQVHVVVKLDGVERPCRTWLSVTMDDVRQYVPVIEIAKDPAISAQVIQAARLDLEGWLRRYEMYKALLGTTTHVRKAIATITKK